MVEYSRSLNNVSNYANQTPRSAKNNLDVQPMPFHDDDFIGSEASEVTKRGYTSLELADDLYHGSASLLGRGYISLRQMTSISGLCITFD